MPSTTSPDQPSVYSPFNRGGKKRRRANAYGQTGMVGPFPTFPLGGARVSGIDTDGMMKWAKENKWYLLGGGLLLGAAIAFAVKS
jgi:hypothetical protein